MSGIQSIGGVGKAGFGQELPGRHMDAVREGETTFADTLKKALGEVSELQDTAQDNISAFLNGEPVEVHEVMAAAEEAGIALEMLIEIRNKLTEAYRTISQMQQ